MRPTDNLPLTGLDILLVGPTTFCQTIAETIILPEDSNKKKKRKLPFETCFTNENFLSSALRAKHVRMTTHFPIGDNDNEHMRKHMKDNKHKNNETHPSDTRVDFIVFVVSLRDATTLSTLESSIKNHIHDDYIYLRRVAIITIHSEYQEKFTSYPNNPILVSILAQAGHVPNMKTKSNATKTKRRRMLNVKPESQTLMDYPCVVPSSKVIEYIQSGCIPIFKCNLENSSSLLHVSTMICQYAKLSKRAVNNYGNSNFVDWKHNKSNSSGLSPLFYSVLL